MSLAAVKKYFETFGMSGRIMVLANSTATVSEAAIEHGVDADQIGKTLSFSLDNQPILIVVSGLSKIDNRKYKAHFQKKAKMLSAEDVLAATGHGVGGVCPFGLPEQIDVYLDISLKTHKEIIPAAGDSYSSIRLSLGELERYSNCKSWIDVCKDTEG